MICNIIHTVTCYSLRLRSLLFQPCLFDSIDWFLSYLSPVRCGNQTSASVVHKEICQNSLALVNLILQRLKKRHACFATALSCVPLDTSSEDCHSESSSQFSLIFSSLLKSCLAVLKSPDFSLESQTSASVLSVSVLRFANGMDNTSTILVNERLASLLQQVREGQSSPVRLVFTVHNIWLLSLLVGCGLTVTIVLPLVCTSSMLCFHITLYLVDLHS